MFISSELSSDPDLTLNVLDSSLVDLFVTVYKNISISMTGSKKVHG